MTRGPQPQTLTSTPWVASPAGLLQVHALEAELLRRPREVAELKQLVRAKDDKVGWRRLLYLGIKLLSWMGLCRPPYLTFRLTPATLLGLWP